MSDTPLPTHLTELDLLRLQLAEERLVSTNRMLHIVQRDVADVQRAHGHLVEAIRGRHAMGAHDQINLADGAIVRRTPATVARPALVSVPRPEETADAPVLPG